MNKPRTNRHAAFQTTAYQQQVIADAAQAAAAYPGGHVGRLHYSRGGWRWAVRWDAQDRTLEHGERWEPTHALN